MVIPCSCHAPAMILLWFCNGSAMMILPSLNLLWSIAFHLADSVEFAMVETHTSALFQPNTFVLPVKPYESYDTTELTRFVEDSR